MHRIKRTNASSWEQVLVRHVIASKRRDIFDITSHLNPPFESYASSCGGPPDKNHSLLAGRWMMAVLWRKTDWAFIFTNGDLAQDTFGALGASRRLEVVWLGFRQEDQSCFFHLKRNRKDIVSLTGQINEPSSMDLTAPELPKGIQQTDRKAQGVFQELCQFYDLPKTQRFLRADKRKFVLENANGQNAMATVSGYSVHHGHMLLHGESPASDRLAEAIEGGDVETIREVIQSGASIDHLPGTGLSPLGAALFRRVDQPNWRECVTTLIEMGAPVDGGPGDSDPPLIDTMTGCTREPMALQITKVLVEYGANIECTDHAGCTPLFLAVFSKKLEVAKYLLEHGADPQAKVHDGKTIVEWLRENAKARGHENLAGLLAIVTGEVSDLPDSEDPDDLRWENERIQARATASKLLKVISEYSITIKKTTVSRLNRYPVWGAWSKELEDLGFQIATHYVQHADWGRQVASVFIHPIRNIEAVVYGELGRIYVRLHAYVETGPVLSVINREEIDRLGFESNTLCHHWMVGASPTELFHWLCERIKTENLKSIQADPDLTVERILALQNQEIQEFREYLKQ